MNQHWILNNFQEIIRYCEIHKALHQLRTFLCPHTSTTTSTLSLSTSSSSKLNTENGLKLNVLKENDLRLTLLKFGQNHITYIVVSEAIDTVIYTTFLTDFSIDMHLIICLRIRIFLNNRNIKYTIRVTWITVFGMDRNTPEFYNSAESWPVYVYAEDLSITCFL